MFATLRNKNFALLWTGGLISQIGNWVLLAALPFHVYAITGSALATSGILIAYIAPGALFGSAAGVFVDRWDRKKVMVFASLLQAAVVLFLFFAQTPSMIWLVYVVAFVEATIGQFFGPAENAVLPTLVGEEHLLSANSLNALNDNLARLVGPAVGGALLGLVGFGSVAAVDAISYLAVALLVALVNIPESARTPAAPSKEPSTHHWREFWQQWLAGLKLVRDHAVLSRLFLVIGLALFGDAILSAVLVVFVQADLGYSPLEFGWIMTARGLGGLIGGLLIAQMGEKLSPAKLMAYGLAATGLFILLMVNVPSLAIILPLITLAGICAVAWLVSIQTLLQQNTEDAYRGRIFGAFSTTNMLLMLLGAIFGGAMADQIGSTALMNGASLIYVLAGGLGFFLLAFRAAAPQPLSQSAVDQQIN